MPSDLVEISAAIHDEYFELERLEHDADRGELRLTIYPGRRKRWLFIESGRPPADPLPPPIGTLVVRDVLAVSVIDDADIGWYDVNRIEYRADTEEVVIVSNVACEIVARCRGLNVELVSLVAPRSRLLCGPSRSRGMDAGWKRSALVGNHR